MKNKLYWIWLSVACGPASTLVQKLLSEFNDDIEAIYNATENEYKNIKLTAKRLKALNDKSLDEAQIIYDWCENNNVGILCLGDTDYPKRLASLPDAPAVLYYIGKLYDIDSLLCIAGVGTRSMSKYGHDTAYTFCHDLARCGAVIVSGMAAGIDTVCHRATLDAGGRTVAVLGCPINKVYPRENRSIMVEIARKGLILTEYHPFQKTMPAFFPQRNRIISGLCLGTVVFEADAGSGSLITANHALKQGRKVYALPGNIGEENSLGTNDLIKNGAKIATGAGDIIDDFSYLYPSQIQNTRVYDYSPMTKAYDSFIEKKRTPSKSKPNTEKHLPMDTAGLSGTEKLIYDRMEFNKENSQELLELNDIPFSEILSSLTMLEIKGYIESRPGGKFIKKR
ncbi:MAG: DNA-processing protein DprA [Clostridia bacterium]|nr:DNA-processing protein DprA [Clostridia bacterium]